MNKPLLEAKNLRISFKTINGTVKAVRGIDFTLQKGKTLGIVGESGSGKSVTSRAVMGILAGNKIIEDGQILYDGMDLLSLSEEDFCKLRGRKISMIFQDPMSSLNPIMRVGKQLTETMFLKEKSTINEAEKTIKLFKKDLLEATNNKSIKDVLTLVENYYHDEAEFDRVLSALKTLQERLDVSLNTVLVNEHAYKANRFKRELNELLFLIKDCNNKYSHESLLDKKVTIKDCEQTLELIKNNKKVNNVADKQVTLHEAFDALRHVSAIQNNESNTASILSYVKSIINEIKKAAADLSKNSKVKYRQNITDAQLKVYDAAFATAVKKEENRYALAVKKALALFTNVKKTTFKNANKLDAKKFAADLKNINKLKDQLSYRYTATAENNLIILINSLSTLLENYKELVEFERKQAKLQAKKGSVELTVKQRAFMSEVNNGSAVILNKIRNTFDSAFNILTELNAHPVKHDVKAAQELLKNSFKNALPYMNKEKANMRAIALMREVGITEPEKRLRQYPFEFSGGMRQRIVIAIALSSDPEILICDEPTTALDVTIQAQILDLITKLKKEKDLSIIFITHDLGVIANMADDIAVMYAGKIVEYGSCEDVFYNPQHPYTWALLASMPDLDTKDKLDAIPGTPPNMLLPPKGDAFAARNRYAMHIDLEEFPPFFKVSDNHFAATWLLDKRAPKVEPPKIVVERIQKAYNAMAKEKTLNKAILANPFIKKGGK